MLNIISCVRLERERFIIEKGCHEENVLFVVLSGSFFLKIESTERVIKKNDVVFFQKNVSFERNVLEPISILYIYFSFTDGNSFVKSGKIDFDDNGRILKNIEMLQSDSFYLKHAVEDFLLCHHYNALHKVQKSAIDGAIEFLRENYSKKISLDRLSEMCMMTKSGFIRKFKAYTGLTPIDYLLLIRLEKAEYMLLNTDLSVKEIANECGYGDPYYFSKAFKLKKGLSPLKYKQKNII